MEKAGHGVEEHSVMKSGRGWGLQITAPELSKDGFHVFKGR